MPIDPSIISQIKPFRLNSPVESYSNALQAQGIANQNRLADLIYSEKQNKIEQENALTGAYKRSFDPSTGTMDTAKLRSELGAMGNVAGIRKIDEDDLVAQKQKLENRLSQIKYGAQIMSGVNDQNSYDLARREISKTIGTEAAENMPMAYSPEVVNTIRNKAMSVVEQAELKNKEISEELKAKQFAYEQERDAANRRVTMRGQDLTSARAREGNALKTQEIAAGGKPPAGYRWVGDGVLEAIPGGPGEKLPESQQKQVVGVNNLSNAINEYREQLKGFGKLDALSPDARAAMGTKYNNMMLQAKEAYNLGVLNGPDLSILTSVITDPRSMQGFITSKGAMDKQASELDRIMRDVGKVSGKVRQPQNKQESPKPAAAASGGAKFLGFE